MDACAAMHLCNTMQGRASPFTHSSRPARHRASIRSVRSKCPSLRRPSLTSRTGQDGHMIIIACLHLRTARLPPAPAGHCRQRHPSGFTIAASRSDTTPCRMSSDPRSTQRASMLNPAACFGSAPTLSLTASLCVVSRAKTELGRSAFHQVQAPAQAVFPLAVGRPDVEFRRRGEAAAEGRKAVAEVQLETAALQRVAAVVGRKPRQVALTEKRVHAARRRLVPGRWPQPHRTPDPRRRRKSPKPGSGGSRRPSGPTRGCRPCRFRTCWPSPLPRRTRRHATPRSGTRRPCRRAPSS